MEDRLTSGLYLEMTDRPATDYARDRVPEVLRRPGVTRATWWENQRRDRKDLPREIAEFSRLGIYEVDAEFTAPDRPDDIDGYHFARTPRPGQGRLTGRPTIGLSLVLISPRRPEEAQALRDWGDFVHIGEIAAAGIGGYSMITPFELVGSGDPRFMHLYEIDRDDPESVFKSMTPIVSKRLGGPDSAEFRRWAFTPELRIIYVNTFALIGEARP